MTDTQPDTPTCCGEGGAWTPKKGEPLITSCQLCPKSPTYWRESPGVRERQAAADQG